MEKGIENRLEIINNRLARIEDIQRRFPFAYIRDNRELQLVSIKLAAHVTGASQSFFKQLLRAKKLRRYKINAATYISLIEFEKLAKPVA